MLTAQARIEATLWMVRLVAAFVQIEHLKPGNSIVLRFDVGSPVRRGHHWVRFLHYSAALRAATSISRVSIFAIASCNAAVNKGTSLD